MSTTSILSTPPIFSLGAAHLRSWNLALRRALKAVPNLSGAILELGCGNGRFIRTIGKTRPGLVRHGLDISPLRIRWAQREDPQGNYLLGSATHLPYASDAIDVVLLMDVLEHLPNPRQGLKEARRVLRPDGTLHALVPCEGQPGTLHWLLGKLGLGADLKRRHEGHVQRFTHGQIVALCTQTDLHIFDISYSMHPLGQIRDLLSYVQREPGAPGWLFASPFYRLLDTSLWLLAYGESVLFGRLPFLAVAMHITARKPVAESPL